MSIFLTAGSCVNINQLDEADALKQKGSEWESNVVPGFIYVDEGQ